MALIFILTFPLAAWMLQAACGFHRAAMRENRRHYPALFGRDNRARVWLGL